MDVIYNVHLVKTKIVKTNAKPASVPAIQKNRFEEDAIIVIDSFNTKNPNDSEAGTTETEKYSYNDFLILFKNIFLF
jgi:hypothetical protein